MLTKNSFPLTNIFLCYQTLKNKENYLYTRFSIKTNKASSLRDYVKKFNFITQKKKKNVKKFNLDCTNSKENFVFASHR